MAKAALNLRSWGCSEGRMATTLTFARSPYFEALLWAVLLVFINSVTSAPTEDLISSLPGQPNAVFKQYGGYVTVDEANGRALYYYFVEAETDPGSKPLTLWLNGGPGCSSLGGGGFSELGPFYPSASGKSLIKNDNSWIKVSNIIFLESPAGVGFSYSNTSSDYTTGDVRTAQDSLKFLLGWFKKFPEYLERDFYIAGESYAGHYAPQLAADILTNNEDAEKVQIQLKGIMVGAPLIDYVIDTVYSPTVYLWSHGLVSEATYNTIMKNCNFSNTGPQSVICTTALEQAEVEAQSLSGYIDPYDVLGDICWASAFEETRRLKIMAMQRKQMSVKEAAVNPCIENDEHTYLNLPEVQSALHAKKTVWSICTDSLNYKMEDLEIKMLPVLRDLLNSGLRIWIFSGDQDSVIPLIGTRQLTDKLGKEFNKTAISPNYTAWFQGKQVGGWTSTWGSLTYATVRGAGHLVPRTQGPRALQLFTSYLEGSPLPSKPH
ncbi:hypothetical protein Mapa_006604 [Marchantia paleacea]|nr:hypothetical protein Mapa_006604 [Marchantia paleacea]